MGALFLSNLHNQYYAWWGTWNFLNDDFYSMWNRQWFFTLTEAISLAVIILFMNKAIDIQPYLVLNVAVIASFHVFIGATDQFVENVIYGHGQLHQVFSI